MSKTVVRYVAEKVDDEHWNVVRKTATPDRYGSWMLSDEKTLVLGEGFKKWNAEYAAACLDYLNHKSKAKNESEFIAESLDCLKEHPVTLSELTFHYVKDSLGNGWGIQNGYKLTCEPFIDLWMRGASCRFGFLPLDSDKTMVFTALADAVSKVLQNYGMRD